MKSNTVANNTTILHHLSIENFPFSSRLHTFYWLRLPSSVVDCRSKTKEECAEDSAVLLLPSRQALLSSLLQLSVLGGEVPTKMARPPTQTNCEKRMRPGTHMPTVTIGAQTASGLFSRRYYQRVYSPWCVCVRFFTHV